MAHPGTPNADTCAPSGAVARRVSEAALPAGTPRMKPADRYNWISDYLEGDRYGGVSVVDNDFCRAYIEATGAAYGETLWGAPKVPQLGRDLAHMASIWRLRRARTGIQGMGGMGFPRWVWTYSLSLRWPGA